MEFKFIDNVINDLSIDLEVLTKDTNLYTTLLFQHKGSFIAEATRFGNNEDCTDKFNAFFTLAKSKNSSLALTPEYSCPWNSIEWLLENEERLPNQSKLWAICCESITPHEIRTFKENHENENTIVYFDENALNNGGAGVLLDPLCYVFKAEQNGINKIIILIQFKTVHMGVWGSPEERKKYIFGDNIYVLRNSPNSIFLFSNICSDATNFSISDRFQEQIDNRWDDNPYIILNPQMNPKPSHDYFVNFRKTILKYSNKDVITLNWAGKTMCPGKAEPLIELSKSSILFKTNDVEFDSDTRFINNHSKGLYYMHSKPKIHYYYLNPYAEVFLISNQKPSSAGANTALIRRTGPEAMNVYKWNGEDIDFDDINVLEDGFADFLDEYQCSNKIFLDSQINFIDKERLINLSLGNVTTKGDDKGWHKIDRLETFQVDANEKIKRLTYVYDELSLEDRKRYLDIIEDINSKILTDENLLPDSLSSFKNNCSEVMFFKKGTSYDYKYNLVTNDSKRKATIAYTGRNTKALARRTYDKLRNLFEEDKYQSRKMVVVWYKEGGSNIYNISATKKPDATDDSTDKPNSIF
ncbi:MAG: Uncharacterised protein [Flavobacteriaceae bacterium]|jgi:hypothetical protein|nr:MAG: Uncharacterised protein [Flavobacteriaceae bacterium]|tara:strand:- start:21505 stop:23250 length:1746 start_codon:yes stop_codon:yes gene_type:complete